VLRARHGAEREAALDRAIQQLLAAADASQYTLDLPDQIVAAIVELEVCATIQPTPMKPIALPEPD
jgi:hypothetical protein